MATAAQYKHPGDLTVPLHRIGAAVLHLYSVLTRSRDAEKESGQGKQGQSWVSVHICTLLTGHCLFVQTCGESMSSGVVSQEGEERRQAGLESGQGVRDREGQSQRRPLRAEVAGQRRVTCTVSGGLQHTGTCQRAAHQPTVPPREGIARHN